MAPDPTAVGLMEHAASMNPAPPTDVDAALLRDAERAPLDPRLKLSVLALPGLRSLRRNWPAIVGLQAVGLAIVVAYYAADGFRTVCDALASAKAAGGLWAAAGVYAVVGGLLPEAAKAVFGIDRTVTRQRLRNTLFNVCVYSVLGLAGDLFYHGLAYAVGTRPTVGSVLAKVALDQFAYTPVLGATLIALAFTWRQYRYDLRLTFAALGRHWYLTRVVILLLPSWAYWTPMCVLMYSLPPGLTFVFSAAASAAAALLLTGVAAESFAPGSLAVGIPHANE